MEYYSQGMRCHLLLSTKSFISSRKTQIVLRSGSGSRGQNPGPQGGEGTRSSSGPQLSNTLTQVKGKFKHGGPKALVDKVPRQAALGKA